MSASTRPRSRRRWLIGGVAAIAVAALIAGLLWFFGGDEPEAVDAERALQQDQDSLSDVFTPDLDLGPGDEDEGDDDPSTEEEPDEDPEAGDDPGDPDDPDDSNPGSEEANDGPPESAEDLDGTWVVDNSREFDRAAGRGTFIGYRIEEQLEGIGSSTAVGRSPEVDGQVVFDGATVTSVRVEGDLTGLESDDERRDSRVQTQLGPDATASFELGEPIELPEVPPVSEVIELTVTGTLTIQEVSNEVDVVLQAAVIETGLLITGSTDVMLSDYGVEVPSAPIVLSVSGVATLEWQLFLVKE